MTDVLKKPKDENFPFSERLFEFMTSRREFQQLEENKLEYLKTIYNNLAQNKINLNLNTNKDIKLIGKNICVSNLKVKFCGDKSKSIIIPIYYPNIDSINLNKLSKSSQPIIQFHSSYQYLLTVHQIEDKIANIDENDFNENHSEKVLMGFVYKYRFYFATIIAQIIKNRNINMLENKIDTLSLHIYSTQDTCASRECVLREEYIHIWVDIIAKIGEILKIQDFEDLYGDDRMVIYKSLAYSLREESNSKVQENKSNKDKIVEEKVQKNKSNKDKIVEEKVQENKSNKDKIVEGNQIEKMLLKDCHQRDYFDLHILKHLITDSLDLGKFKRILWIMIS